MDFNINSSDYQQKLNIAWRHFIKNESFDYSIVRPEILDSWKRSRSINVDPINTNYTNLNRKDLNLKINRNMDLINIVHPYIENLYSTVKGSGSYILLCDQDGYIIDYKGDNDIIAKSDANKLGPGAARAEKDVGTNGIGTALYLKRPIQIWGEEHYSEKQKKYTCSGAPFFDTNGNLRGCINITVAVENAHPHTLGMVVCAADSITKELRLRQTMEQLEVINAQRNSIIENMTSGVILLTQSGRVIQINRHALKMLNLSYESIIGQNLFDYITIDDHDRYSAHNILVQEKYNEETTVCSGLYPGHPKRFNLSVIHVKDDNGTVTGTMLRFNKPELINRLVKNISGFRANYTFDSIIGNSEPVKKMISDSRLAAEGDSNVLILGESGTGKELIAQSIHNASPVSSGPFVAINCAAIPKGLVESELFGYEKGAFTGAEKEGRPGKFEMADGGTIFLDEIGDMPLNIQATLLRVIQTKEVVRIGGEYPKPINIRIIAATNQDLMKAVKNKEFREDLYYRLNVYTINTPPLRKRGASDIRLLTDHFIRYHSRSKSSNIIVSPEVYEILENYCWPGNVRQLENIIERAVNLTGEDRTIRYEHLPDDVTANECTTPLHIEHNDSPHVYESAAQKNEKNSFGAHESHQIVSALQRSGGNVTRAAKFLDMNLRTLYRRLQKYEIDANDYRN